MAVNNCKNEIVIDLVQGVAEFTSDAIAADGPLYLDMQNMEVVPGDELVPPPDCETE